MAERRASRLAGQFDALLHSTRIWLGSAETAGSVLIFRS
jgi:hypothetical protein